ncbi:hypothetical protein JCM1841_004347 [Sporobolomyces salmonicolor]
MSCRRSVSLSRSVFWDDADTLERSAGGLSLAVSIQEACVVQVLSTRPAVRVRKSARAWTFAVPPPARRPTPKRAMTRLIPTVSSNKDEDKPFEKRNFQRGLRWAGYLEPLDTSRKKIKQRLVLGLEKEDFTAHLDAFLEQKGIKKRGEWMVRFVGATDPHSPFVHLFTTSRLTNPAPVKVYPGDLGTTSSQGPDAFTQGTNLPSSAPGESEWACKAKHFWPPPDEIDLDVELERRATLEADTQTHARRPSASVKLGQTRLGQLRGWFQPSSARVELYDYDEEEEHARKERRRARRREEEEARELERRVEQDFDAEKEDRRARKEERRRRRAERELAGQ